MNATTGSYATPAAAGSRTDAMLLLLRLAIALLFVVAGVRKLVAFDGTVQWLSGMGLPVAMAVATAVILVEIVGGLAIASGVLLRPAAGVVAAFTALASVIGHPFWIDPTQLYDFLKNVIVIAALLLLWVTGPGRYAPGARPPSR